MRDSRHPKFQVYMTDNMRLTAHQYFKTRPRSLSSPSPPLPQMCIWPVAAESHERRQDPLPCRSACQQNVQSCLGCRGCAQTPMPLVVHFFDKIVSGLVAVQNGVLLVSELPSLKPAQHRQLSLALDSQSVGWNIDRVAFRILWPGQRGGFASFSGTIASKEPQQHRRTHGRRRGAFSIIKKKGQSRSLQSTRG